MCNPHKHVLQSHCLKCVLELLNKNNFSFFISSALCGAFTFIKHKGNLFCHGYFKQGHAKWNVCTNMTVHQPLNTSNWGVNGEENCLVSPFSPWAMRMSRASSLVAFDQVSNQNYVWCCKTLSCFLQPFLPAESFLVVIGRKGRLHRNKSDVSSLFWSEVIRTL